MKPIRPKISAQRAPARELARLRARVAETDEILRAIHTGEVDTVVVPGKEGPQVFTLQGAEHPYRMLIESMNEGALTLTADAVILYANRCFAKMLKCPLERVIGSSFRRFLSAGDRAMIRPLLKRADESGSKIQVLLHAGDGSLLPAQISIRPLARIGSARATFGMVLTDVTEARNTEERLRALTNRVVQVQEAERARFALELHDRITQPLCAILFRSQALAQSLLSQGGPMKRDAQKLRELLGRTAAEVERISRDLRPGVLDQLGLVAVIRATNAEFSVRTGVAVSLACVPAIVGLPAGSELALFRILQEALRNVERHARARHVTVCLRQLGDFMHMVINDDGIGFDPNRHRAAGKRKGGLGLLGMRERANFVGGLLTVKSTRSGGTEIAVRIPLVPGAREKN